MDTVEALRRLGGVSDTATLRLVSSRKAIARAVREGRIVRDERGRYALPTADEALRAAGRLTAVVSHTSAAAYWHWKVKRLPDKPTVTVPRNRRVSPARRETVSVTWADLAPEEVEAGVTSRDRTLIDCAKKLPFDEALAIADSALRRQDVSKRHLRRLAEAVRGRGRERCLRVAHHADGRAANPFESVLRGISIDVPGVDLVPQRTIRLTEGEITPDLVDMRLRLVVEADSFAWHSSRTALTEDSERYNAAVCAGWRVLRFCWEHVMYEPEYVAQCLAAMAGGPSNMQWCPRPA